MFIIMTKKTILESISNSLVSLHSKYVVHDQTLDQLIMED